MACHAKHAHRLVMAYVRQHLGDPRRHNLLMHVHDLGFEIVQIE